MTDQIALLHDVPWRSLFILDALRWDVWRALTGLGDPVRSPATCTAEWLRAVRPIMEAAPTRYVTANGVVCRRRNRFGPGCEIVALYKRHSSPCALDGRKTVSPWAVNACVMRDIAAGAMADARIVVHYVQPHAPPIAYARRRRTSVRRDYEGSADVVIRAARHLARWLPQPAVITADHGEMLGEHRKRGHNCRWDYPELRAVPWHVVGDLPPAEETTTLQNLKHMGYA